MTDAEKREKVIQALENCICYPKRCQNCPWDVDGEKCSESFSKSLEYPSGLVEDALALLKEQEPRVLTPYEVRAEYEIVWLDRKNISCEVAILQRIACGMYEFSIMGTDEMPSLLESQYGKTWRCWTSRPSEQQMRDTPWGGDSDAE